MQRVVQGTVLLVVFLCVLGPIMEMFVPTLLHQVLPMPMLLLPMLMLLLLLQRLVRQAVDRAVRGARSKTVRRRGALPPPDP